MSHTTEFTPPRGWAKAALIHDGYGMPGTIELRAWYPIGPVGGESRHSDESIAYFDRSPDIVILLHEDCRVETRTSGSAPEPQKSLWLEQELLYRAGMVVGSARLGAKINGVLEDHVP